MDDQGSVTHWIHEIKKGESAAANALWELYFEKLVRLARGKLDGMPRRVADEEDVALSAFHSFCQAAKKGRFPDLADRESLWRLLLQMTARKAIDLIRYSERKKRKVFGESAIGESFEDTDVTEASTDVNDSGTVDIADPIYLLNSLFGGGPQPPAPFATCGFDPDLTCDLFEGCM